MHFEEMGYVQQAHPRFSDSRRTQKIFCSNLKSFSGVVADGENKKVIAYSRVSSHDQKEDLKSPSQVLNTYCIKEFSGHEVIEDLGSGMNYKKKGLKKLINMILSGQVSDIVLTH